MDNVSVRPVREITFRQKMIILFIGGAFTVYLGFLLGASYTGDIGKLPGDFYEFVIRGRHFIVAPTRYTLPFSAALFFVWFILWAFWSTAISHPYSGREFGSRRFMPPKMFTRIYADNDRKNLITVDAGSTERYEIHYSDGKLEKKRLKKVRIDPYNRRISENCFVDIRNLKTSNLNMLIAGPPGCGKSFRFSKPVLSGLNGHYIVTDPKGELCRDTAQYFIDNGYEVLVVDTRNAYGMLRSVHFNPFVYLRDQKDLNEMVEVLIASTTPPDANKGDPFWEKSETKFFAALFELIFYSYPKEKQTWRTLINLIDRTEILRDQNGHIVPNEIMREMEKENLIWQEEHNGDNHPAYQDYKDVFGGAFETVASIVLSAKVRCTNMKLEEALSMMDYDDMDIFGKFAYSGKSKKCRSGKRILYIITKESDHSMDWYISILYMTFFTQLYDKADNDFCGKLPLHVTYLMDEFANVTLSQNFRELLSTMRGRNISAIMIVQSYQQLKEKYPKNDGWQGLIGQCCFRLLLGPPDKETREYFSKMLGTTTINKASTSNPQGFMSQDNRNNNFSKTEDVVQRDLMTVGDLGELPISDCIIDINGSSPVYDEKCRMEHSPLYGLLCNPERNYQPPDERHMHTDVFFGSEALELIESAKEQGLCVITLSEKDIDAIMDSDFISLDEPVDSVPADVLKKNYEDYLKHMKEREIDMSEYTIPQIKVVQGLKNRGFSSAQINAMSPMIKKDAALEELLTFFNPDMAADEISEFVQRVEEM